MNPTLQVILSLVLAVFGARGLLFGKIDTGGAEGGEPTCFIRGGAAKLIGALLLVASLVLLFSSTYGILAFLATAVFSVFVCRAGRYGR